MMPSLGDHLIVALLTLAYPLYFMMEWRRRLRPELETGATHARSRFYRRSMVEFWLLTPLILSWWLWSGRGLAAVGLGVPGGWAFWIGAIVVVALAIVLGLQVAAVRSSSDAQAQVRKQFRGVPALMVPRDDRERRMWVGLSLTAGFCEEVLYRGFLIWYSTAWLPGAAAVLVCAVLFGLAHLYLGWGVGVLRATIVGVVLGAAYLLTGSLWVPIVLHVVVDIASGFTGSAAFEQGAATLYQAPGERAQQQHAADGAVPRG